MKRIFIAILSWVCSSTLCFSIDVSPCETYPDFYPRCIVRGNCMKYYLFEGKDKLEIVADSVWINNQEGETIMTVRERQGEQVDISSLYRGYYICNFQIGDCIGADMFYNRKNPEEDILTPDKELIPASKLLHDGQVLILKQNKKYTIDGKVIEL